MTDHKEAAEERLEWLNPPDAATRATVALAHAMLAVVERLEAIADVLDDLSCIVAVPSVIPDEEDDD
ncbi:hypothetical protein MINTMi27_15620 [Mycobacterium intracellulare]|uniref:hypothetical protein n=1 Tax=Mycobacterium intracellulare TaxID=1767 RepID=UPI001927AD10|nr:hypothetical protein [Mycobacterium intracellulare]BCP41469.1 hypothetical protein MINTMi27_15620 [Mycobacterium intracellulare]